VKSVLLSTELPFGNGAVGIHPEHTVGVPCVDLVADLRWFIFVGLVVILRSWVRATAIRLAEVPSVDPCTGLHRTPWWAVPT
jgi:hypothetical protein